MILGEIIFKRGDDASMITLDEFRVNSLAELLPRMMLVDIKVNGQYGDVQSVELKYIPKDETKEGK